MRRGLLHFLLALVAVGAVQAAKPVFENKTPVGFSPHDSTTKADFVVAAWSKSTRKLTWLPAIKSAFVVLSWGEKPTGVLFSKTGIAACTAPTTISANRKCINPRGIT